MGRMGCPDEMQAEKRTYGSVVTGYMGKSGGRYRTGCHGGDAVGVRNRGKTLLCKSVYAAGMETSARTGEARDHCFGYVSSACLY